MNTDLAQKPIVTTVTVEDRRGLEQLLRAGRGQVRLAPLGTYAKMTSDDIWFALVSQVCVMGSSRGMEAIVRAPARRQSFMDAIRPAVLRETRSVTKRVAEVLADFSATRFPTKNAAIIATMLDSKEIVAGNRVVVLDSLTVGTPPDELRRELRRRCPLFNLKSASDFLINVGLSDDVIALDTRVVGALRKHFGFNLRVAVVQARQPVYLSIEAALRDACTHLGVRLAELDRTIFQLAGRSALGRMPVHRRAGEDDHRGSRAARAARRS